MEERLSYQDALHTLSDIPCSWVDVARLKGRYSDGIISSARLEERIGTLPDLLRVLAKRDELSGQVVRDIERRLRPTVEMSMPQRIIDNDQPRPPGIIKERVKAMWYSTLFSFDLIARNLLHIIGNCCRKAINPFKTFCSYLAFNYAFYVKLPSHRHVRNVLRRNALALNVCSLLLFCLDVFLINLYRILQYVVKSATMLIWYKLLLVIFSFLYAKYDSSVCEARNYIRSNILEDQDLHSIEIV